MNNGVMLGVILASRDYYFAEYHSKKGRQIVRLVSMLQQKKWSNGDKYLPDLPGVSIRIRSINSIRRISRRKTEFGFVIPDADNANKPFIYHY